MMNITEAEAKKKICPTLHTFCDCWGSDCMAWQWEPDTETIDVTKHNPDCRGKLTIVDVYSDQGFCVYCGAQKKLAPNPARKGHCGMLPLDIITFHYNTKKPQK